MLGGELEVGSALMAFCFRCYCLNESRPDIPRTIQEILDQQDELADKFVNFERALGHERPIEEYLRSSLENQESDSDSAGRLIG